MKDKPTRGGAAAARWAHNPKVGGSNPPPATICPPQKQPLFRGAVVFYGNILATSFSATAVTVPLERSSSNLKAAALCSLRPHGNRYRGSTRYWYGLDALGVSSGELPIGALL